MRKDRDVLVHSIVLWNGRLVITYFLELTLGLGRAQFMTCVYRFNGVKEMALHGENPTLFVKSYIDVKRSQCKAPIHGLKFQPNTHV